MSIGTIASKFGKFADDNSPVILTAVGVAGVITTAALAAKAGFRAGQIIDEERRRISLEKTGQDDNWFDVPARRAFDLTWREYIPSCGVAIGTVGAIVMSTRIGSRRAAAVAAAYSISEKAFTEYKEKVVQHIGQNKEQKVRDEIAQDRVDNSKGTMVIVTGTEQLCYESYSDRWFKSDMETLKKAQNDLNHRILNQDYASLSDFYDLLGLNHTQESDNMGWNVDKLLDLEFSTTLSPDQKPAIAIDFRVVPIRGYHRLS